MVIIGLLAAVATFMFSKQTRKARAGEVDAVFAEIALKQEAYRAREGRYFSEEDYFPVSPPGAVARPATGTVNIERALRLDIKSNLYCSYKSPSSETDLHTTAGSSNSIANEFDIGSGLSIVPPPVEGTWYINAAICDFDGNGVYSYYAQPSWTDQKLVSNPGE